MRFWSFSIIFSNFLPRLLNISSVSGQTVWYLCFCSVAFFRHFSIHFCLRLCACNFYWFLRTSLSLLWLRFIFSFPEGKDLSLVWVVRLFLKRVFTFVSFFYFSSDDPELLSLFRINVFFPRTFDSTLLVKERWWKTFNWGSNPHGEIEHHGDRKGYSYKYILLKLTFWVLEIICYFGTDYNSDINPINRSSQHTWKIHKYLIVFSFNS